MDDDRIKFYRKGVNINIIIFISYFALLLLILGVVKCDTINMQKHLEECKKHCEPYQMIEIFSRNKCVCSDIEIE